MRTGEKRVENIFEERNKQIQKVGRWEKIKRKR